MGEPASDVAEPQRTADDIVRAPARNRFTSRFKDRELEAEFQKATLADTARTLRFSLGLTTLVFVFYGIHDAIVVPSAREPAWFVRYVLFLPIALGVLLLVGTTRFRGSRQPASLLYGVSANFVVLYIAAISPDHGYYIYTSYAVLFLTLGPFIARMNVVTQLIYIAAVVLLYNVLDRLTGANPVIRASFNFTLLSMGFIGVLSAYQLERDTRDSFLQKRAIEEQMAALDAEKSRSEALLLNVLPPNIAERLKAENESIAEGFANVSVLFADLVGFTNMSARMSPEEVVKRLNLIFSNFDDLAEKLKLEKIKTIGDAYMVAGGLHSLEYDHAQAIAEMALAMQRRVTLFSEEFGEKLSIRVGINTGPVVAGVIGKKKFIYDVWGDTVNTASRMESHSEPGSIQVTESTYEALKVAYKFEPRGEIQVKGKGTMKTYYLVGRLFEKDANMSQRTQLPKKKVQN